MRNIDRELLLRRLRLAFTVLIIGSCAVFVYTAWPVFQLLLAQELSLTPAVQARAKQELIDQNIPIWKTGYRFYADDQVPKTMFSPPPNFPFKSVTYLVQDQDIRGLLRFYEDQAPKMGWKINRLKKHLWRERIFERSDSKIPAFEISADIDLSTEENAPIGQPPKVIVYQVMILYGHFSDRKLNRP